MNTVMTKKKDNEDMMKPCFSRQVGSAGYLRVIEDASAIVGADDGILPILAKVSCSDEACLAIHLIPKRHLLVWNVPEP